MEYAESSTVELKEIVTNFHDVGKTVCGFANADGGKLVIGITSTGIVVGVPSKEIELLQQRIEGAVQIVNPVPFHKIEVVDEEKKKLLVLEIYKIGEGSFCTYGGIVYYRFGNTLKKLDGKLLQDFLIHRKILSFDESSSEATLADLDDIKIETYLKRRTPDFEYIPKEKENVLASLGVVKKNGTLIVKNTAVLLFAKSPNLFLPQSECKLVRFKGIEPIDVIDSRYVQGIILELLKNAEDFVIKNTRLSYEIKELERKEISEYPSEVVREALVNSLVHRDYFSKDSTQINIFDDRLEIISPGGLPQGLSMKLLGTLSIQRNPLVYRLLRDIRLMEGLATGIPRMRRSMRDRGLPDPVFEDLGSFFKVTLYNCRKVGSILLNSRHQKILTYLLKNNTITTVVVAKITGVSQVTAAADMNTLVRKGYAQKIGKTRGAYYILKNP